MRISVAREQTMESRVWVKPKTVIQGTVHGRYVTLPGCSVRTYENLETAILY